MAKILIVDDDADCVELLSIHLLKRGHRVVGAKDGAEALERAAWERPDAILLDLRLPGVEGGRVLEILRRNELTSKTPVVMITASDRKWAVSRIVQDPLTHLLEKPLDFEALDACLGRLISA